MPITLSRDFDGGNYASATYDEATETVSLARVSLYSSFSGAGGVRITGLQGTRLSLRVDHADDESRSPSTERWRGAWSTDPHGDDWRRFDSQTYEGGGSGTWVLAMDAPWAVDDVYVRTLPSHSVGRAQANVGAWLAHPAARPTASADAAGVFSTAPPVTDHFGKPIPALPRLGIEVGSGPTNVILTSRVHPTEEHGGYSLEGFMDVLLSGGAAGTRLLEACTFLVYPCISVRSIYAGLPRYDWEAQADANRIWDETGSANLEAFKAAMRADSGGVVHGWIDFHTYPNNPRNDDTEWIWMDPDHPTLPDNRAYRDRLATEVSRFGRDLQTYDFSLLAGAAVGWGAGEFPGMTLGVLNELGHSINDGVDVWRRHGASSAYALDTLILDGEFGASGPSASPGAPDAPTALAYVSDPPPDTTRPEVEVFEVTADTPGRLRVAFRVTEPLASAFVTLETDDGAGGSLSLPSFVATDRGSGRTDYVADVARAPGTYTVTLVSAEDGSDNPFTSTISVTDTATVTALPVAPEGPAPDAGGPKRKDGAVYGTQLPDPVVVDEVMRFAKGFQSFDPLVLGFLGAGMGFFRQDGRWRGQIDDLTVTGSMQVFELLLSKIRVVLGAQVFSSGGGTVDSVDLLPSGLYRCRWKSDDGMAPVGEGDLLEAEQRERPKGSSENGFGIYLSRLTVAAMDNGATYADCYLEPGGKAPEAGMEYAQMGNTTNPDRQGLVYINAFRYPGIQVRDGIDSWQARDSASTLKVVVGDLRVLGFYANGPRVYGMAGGDFAGAWFSLTGTGLEFRRGFDDEPAAFFKGDTFRIGRGESYYEVDLAAGSADQYMVDPETGQSVRVRQILYGPAGDGAGGIRGALSEIEALLTDPETGVARALASLRQRVEADLGASLDLASAADAWTAYALGVAEPGPSAAVSVVGDRVEIAPGGQALSRRLPVAPGDPVLVTWETEPGAGSIAGTGSQLVRLVFLDAAFAEVADAAFVVAEGPETVGPLAAEGVAPDGAAWAVVAVEEVEDVPLRVLTGRASVPGRTARAVNDLRAALYDEDGLVAAQASLEQEVFEELDADGRVTLRGAANALTTTVYDGVDGLVPNQAALRQRVDRHGARQVLSVNSAGGLAEIVLASGEETGNAVTVRADQLNVDALRTVIGSPSELVLNKSVQSWGNFGYGTATPPPATGVSISTGDDVHVWPGANVMSRPLLRCREGDEVELDWSGIGALNTTTFTGYIFFLGAAYENIGHVRTFAQAAPANGNYALREVAPAGAHYVAVGVNSVSDTTMRVTLARLRVVRKVDLDDLVPTLLVNGLLRAQALDVPGIARILDLVVERFSAAVGDILLARIGDLITLDGANGQIELRGPTGDRFAISGHAGFDQSVSGTADLTPPVSTFSGEVSAEATTGDGVVQSLFFEEGQGAALEGAQHWVQGLLQVNTESQLGATATASARVRAWYEDGSGQVVAGSMQTVSRGATGSGPFALSLPEAPAGATVHVEVRRDASAEPAEGSGFSYAAASARVSGLTASRSGSGREFLGPPGIAFTDDQGNEVYLRREGGVAGAQTFDLGGMLLRRGPSDVFQKSFDGGASWSAV